MKPHEAAFERPLVVCFSCDRFDLLSMALPRVVNATRRIGGYLWVIDDASIDTRVQPFLGDYLSKGYIDYLTLGSQRRFIDWTETEDHAWGGSCARNSVAIRYLATRGAPMAIFIHGDIMVAEDSFATLLEGARVAREGHIPASTYCGFRLDPVLYTKDPIRAEGHDFRLLDRSNSLQLNLTPFDVVRQLETDPSRDPKRWSMNQVAAHAYELLGLEACYVMNVASQHLGVNILGRTWTDSASICRGSPIALEEDGSVQQVPGFDVAGFMEASKQSCYKVFWFAHHDKPNQHIIDRQPVHPCFDRLK